HSIVAVQTAPLAVREENIWEPVIVVVNRADATESVLHYTEFQMHVRRLNVELGVSLVLEVYADRGWIQLLESSAITSYSTSPHRLPQSLPPARPPRPSVHTRRAPRSRDTSDRSGGLGKPSRPDRFRRV